MEPSQLLDKAMKEISKGRINVAFEKIEKALELLNNRNSTAQYKRLKVEFVGLSEQYYRNQKNKSLGIASAKHIELKSNQIGRALVEIIIELENELLLNSLEKDKMIDRILTDVLDEIVTTEVEIKINEDINSYGDENKKKLMEAIQSILEIPGSKVTITRIESGSVKVIVKVPVRLAYYLVKLTKAGYLSRLKATEAKIVNRDSPRNVITKRQLLEMAIRKLPNQEKEVLVTKLVYDNDLKELLGDEYTEQQENRRYNMARSLLYKLIDSLRYNFN